MEIADIYEDEFLSRYINDMVESLKCIYPKKKETALRKFVEKQVLKNEHIDNPHMMELYNNYTQKTTDIDLLTLLNYYYKKKPIMTSYGVMFKQHSKKKNINGLFVQYLKDERTVYKKIQFEGIEEHDDIKRNRGEQSQKTMKLLNNSYYGVTGEASSQFYNPLISPSITYTGYSIITSSILGFEMLLADNVKYDNFNDLLIYITTVLKDRNKSKESFGIIDDYLSDKFKVKPNDVYHRLKNLCAFKLSDKELSKLKSIIKKMDQTELNEIYYTNNFYEFIGDNSHMYELLKNILDTEGGIIDPKEASEETQVQVNELWELIENFVIYDHQIYNRGERARTMNRDAIIVVDTDSNFISLDKYFNFVIDNFHIEEDENETNYYTIINSAVLILSKYIQKVLDRFTGNCNLVPEKQPIINMKSEFIYKRIMLTRNKKQYAAICVEQEGKVLDPPELDMKGMSIKKANVNNRTREYFTSLIKDEILEKDSINLVNILSAFEEFENEIRQSLYNGEITFLTPDKVNDINSYKNPERQQSVRGTIIWNELFPENTIQPPDKVNKLKIKGEILSDLKPIYHLEDKYNIIKQNIFDDEVYSSYGFTVLSLPKSVDKIPSWIIPLIDFDSIIEDNIRVGTLILESLGFKLVSFNNKEYYTTLLEI
jgi:hypothetical protein